MNKDYNKNNITNMPKQTYELISQIIKFIDNEDRKKEESRVKSDTKSLSKS